MKNINTIIIVAIKILILNSCVREKIVTQKIDGYFFSLNPKNTTKEDVVDNVLCKPEERIAQKNNEKTFTGCGRKNKNGNIQTPKIKYTDYMLIFNQQEFEKVVKCANNYDKTRINSVNFSKEFVFLLIHSSKIKTGFQFFDELNAYVINESTMQLKPHITAIPYAKHQKPVRNFNENDYQTYMYKIPKSKFQTINIEWKLGEIETVKMGI